MKAECKQFDLSRYLDGDLPEPQRTRVAEHLARCPRCRAVLEEFRRVDGWVKAAHPPVPEVDWPGFYRRVVEGLRRRERVIRLTAWAGGVLAAAARESRRRRHGDL